MTRTPAATDAPVATTSELLQSALRRSQRRNRWVAWRRLGWRWTVWGLAQALRWLTVPALLALGLVWWLSWRTSPPPAPAAGLAGPAPAASAPAETPPPETTDALRLRMDAEPAEPRRSPRRIQLPLPRPDRAGSVPTQESP